MLRIEAAEGRDGVPGEDGVACIRGDVASITEDDEGPAVEFARGKGFGECLGP